MLAELTPLSYEIPLGETRLHLRYDINALLRLERFGLRFEDIFAEEISGLTLVKFLRAGLPEDIGEKNAIGVLNTLGIHKLWEHLRAAVALSLPEYDPLIIPDNSEPSGGELDFGRLRTLFCDIMKKSDDLFWQSTLRELLSRWQGFAVVKGYAKEPERMRLYDTEGM